MTILLVSMPSVHVFKWVKHLQASGYTLYWFDILKKGYQEELRGVTQITNWYRRKLPYIKGSYWLQKNKPALYEQLAPFLEVTAAEQLDTLIKELQPDVVHSFEMFQCSYPILKAMQKCTVKWLYSCWGSDLYYYKQYPTELNRINEVLKRVDVMHADCERDFNIASDLGFEFTPRHIIAGGGGVDLMEVQTERQHKQRNTILVKGYQHNFGRAINVLKALLQVQADISTFEIVVFAAHASTIKFITENNMVCQCYGRHDLSNTEVLDLMRRSIVYIGNSISDGIPNTLLEAMSRGVFPIQSNPGGATQEIIEDGVNGFLIEDPNDISDIAASISKAINNKALRFRAAEQNYQIVKERYASEIVGEHIRRIYNTKISRNETRP